ncbi:hypothetical protein GOODEAATRI_013665 [Goodea atripinnis]|uniref:Leucine-rich repeat-containing protein 28 n=1 Tax=Goodea atripinnis TaxID=208336 RepID=A0ABV0PXR6_9TELE
MGQLEALRDLNIRRNHLVRLPPELAELPLVRLDFSCNKVTSIPVCYRGLAQLQAIVLDNNPLQSPPAQICIKGKVHIFKFLNLEASKTTPELPEYDRRPLTSWLQRSCRSCRLETTDEQDQEDLCFPTGHFMAYIERRITREVRAPLSCCS